MRGHDDRGCRLTSSAICTSYSRSFGTDSVMTNASTTRRRFLVGAAAAVSGAAGSSFALAQGAPRPPAAPLVRPADIILKNGKVLTIDRDFSIAQAIAISGDRIAAVGPDEAMTAHTAP